MKTVQGYFERQVSQGSGLLVLHNEAAIAAAPWKEGWMSTEENTARYRRFQEEIWNKHNLAVIDELAAPTFVRHEPASPGPVQGPEGLKQFVGMIFAGIPDASLTIEDAVSEGDKVVVRWKAGGTMQGEMMGMAPTGKQATISGINIGRFEGGQVVEEWASWDVLGMLQQFGLVPTPGAGPA